MLKRSGNKPSETRNPLFSEEELKKLLGEDAKKKETPDAKTFKNNEEKIPAKNKILDKYKESKKEGSLIKIISHRKLLEKLNYTQEKK